MTNYDKQQLRKMILEGKSDMEILRYVNCKPSTIKNYRKVFKSKQDDKWL